MGKQKLSMLPLVYSTLNRCYSISSRKAKTCPLSAISIRDPADVATEGTRHVNAWYWYSLVGILRPYVRRFDSWLPKSTRLQNTADYSVTYFGGDTFLIGRFYSLFLRFCVGFRQYMGLATWLFVIHWCIYIMYQVLHLCSLYLISQAPG